MSLKIPVELPVITVLYDNRKHDARLKEGFGFSCVVDWYGEKTLFDTGGKIDAFRANSEEMGLSFNQINRVLFSHHHWDHTAGINQVLREVPEGTSVYLPDPFSSSVRRNIPETVQVVKVTDFHEIDKDKGIYSLVLKGGYFCTSIYEQALLLKTEKGVVVITGCAHPGIVKIIKEAIKRLGPVHMVMGGFHLHHSWKCTSAKVVREFQNLKVERVAPCHCSGDKAIAQLKTAFQDDFIQVGTGSIIQI